MIKNLNYFKFVFVILLLIFTQFVIQAQTPQEAINYLKSIEKNYSSLPIEMWDYVKSAAHSKFAIAAEGKRKKLITSVKKALKLIEKESAFYNDNSYKESVLTYLNTLYHMLVEDYSKIVDMEKISEDSYDHMEAYLTAKKMAGEKLNDTGEELNNSLKDFAKKYQFELSIIESDIDKKLKESGIVMDYYNKIYLIFFKSNKQEIYLINAVDKGDLSEIEQNKNTLADFSKEGLTLLKKEKAFNNDKSLIDISVSLLEFYFKEASEDYSIAIEYLMERDKFNKIRQAFEAKKDSEKTQDIVDQYNKSVNQLNDLVNKYNIKNKELNEKRIELINNWNNISKKFIDTHVPN